MKKSENAKRRDKFLKKYNIPKEFTTYSYVKQEDSCYIAICVNLSLFAQSNTPANAIDKLDKAVTQYLDYVTANHPDKWIDYTNRPVPNDIMQEYLKVFQEQLDKIRSKELFKQSLEVSRQYPLLLNIIIAKKISPPYAQANM